VAKGLRLGTVMPPTLTRIAYLTLRGVVLARSLESVCLKKIKIVEVHPLATLALRGDSPARVRSIRSNVASRSFLLRWLSTEGDSGVDGLDGAHDRVISACACVLAVWKWVQGEHLWIQKASPPHHLYDFEC
jgi:predicted nuclease with RNAse H fold